MDSEVIYIEDSPPVTPEKNSNNPPYEICTTTIGKITENTVRKLLSTDNTNKNDAINLTKKRTSEPNLRSTKENNVLKQIITNTDNVNTQMSNSCNFPYYPNNLLYELNPQNMVGGTICYPIFDGNTSITPIAYPLTTIANGTHFMAPTKITNLNYTAKFYNNEEYANILPEFVDINSYMEYSYYKENMATELPTKKQENVDSTVSNYKTPIQLQKIKTPSKMNVIDLSIDTKNTNEKSNDTDDDCVFVGAYAREPNTMKKTVYKLPAAEEKTNEIQASFSVDEGQSSQDDDKGKRKRKPVVTVPRRNPKRQVQIEKDYLKLLDNVLNENEKKSRPKKVKKSTKGTSPGADNKKSGGTTSNKKTSRQTNCGAVYCPPSPLSSYHFKKWPVTGMHERPEFNPITGKLEPLDSIVRNISEVYNQQEGKNDTNKDEKSTENEENKELWLLCHEMLHHVFAYGATVKRLKDDENGEEYDKDVFLNDLNVKDALMKPLNLSKKKRKTSPSKKNDEDLEDVKNLMENSLLLYCLTNDVDRNDLSKYIDSLVPDELIEWSNKAFNLTD